ncbi:MAG TPA: hypothetical protein DEQ27_03100 [Prevotella sp.]|nr:hypothetical protein [Prevotella sp.]
MRLAVKGIEGLVASDYEFHLPQPSYMLHTLQCLRRDYPEDSFSLVIGADNWACFDRWFGYREIISGFPIFIYPRKGTEIDVSLLPSTVKLLDTGLYNISSTEIRQRLMGNKSIDGLVPKCVADYLSSHTSLLSNLS